jgi:predicted peptidase
MVQTAHTFVSSVTQQVKLDYWLYLPPAYGQDSQHKWPLILFLHGFGERSPDLELVKKHGPPQSLSIHDDPRFMVASPQCPAGSWWTFELEALNALLDDLIGQYAVDVDRVYLTGLSMGGFGTWHLATLRPERFAAIAPICGEGVPALADRLKHLPIWAFHGEADDVVPVSFTQTMVEAVTFYGGNVKYTGYPGVGHDSWTQTYANPELYEWFLRHRRSQTG